MPEYRLSLDFTADDDAQAARLAEAWAGTCAAEFGTRMSGLHPLNLPAPHPVSCLLPEGHLGACTTTISPVRPAQPRFCVTLGHEQIAATTVGTYDDSINVYPDTAYCDSCARTMTACGDFTADDVPMSLTSGHACQWCGRAIVPAGCHDDCWQAAKGTDPLPCDANHDDGRHEPAATGTYPPLPKEGA